VLVDASQPGAQAPDAPPVAVIARPLGVQTNNFAEYTAVILALERASELSATEVELVLDSKLVVEQLSGRWKVRHAQIRPLVERAHALLAGFDRWSVRHEPRAANHAADSLANLALDNPAAAARAEGGELVVVPPAPTEPVATVAVGSACAVFDQRGRVLLVRHTYGALNWELPGGLALAGEAPDGAAQRELAEETGLRLAAERLAGVYFEAGHQAGPALHFVFLFDWRDDQSPRPRPPEVDEVGFWPPDELPRPLSDFTQRRILDAQRDRPVFEVIGPRRWLD
jgi:8-oxo-dGTP diphosphatase